MSATEVRHPIFARFFDRLSRLMEREVGEHRDELLAGLSGRVVEIGAGNGMNFQHYPTTVEEVVALEPEAYLREKAEDAARAAPVRVTVRDAAADPLPLEEAGFDAAVASLVLCTVPDPAGALAELRRVLKPGAKLRFMEHVRSDRPRKARLQERLDRWGVWPRVGGGCHCARDTVGAIEAAGFRIERVRELRPRPVLGGYQPARPRHGSGAEGTGRRAGAVAPGVSRDRWGPRTWCPAASSTPFGRV